jgi:hypothetical protein
MNKRNSFVFYRSWIDAIQTLGNKNRLAAFEAIARYSLDKEITEGLSPRVLAILKLAIPNIDANYKKYLLKMKDTQQAAGNTQPETNENTKVSLPLKEYK